TVALGSNAPLPPPSVLAAAGAAVAQCHCAPQLPARDYLRLEIPDSTGSAGALLIEPSNLMLSDSSRSASTPGLPVADSVGVRDAIVQMLPMLRNGGVAAVAVTRTDTYMDTLRAVAIISPKFGADGRIRAVYGMIVTPRDF